MKILQSIIFFVLLGTLPGCFQEEEKVVGLSFWTDRDLADGAYNLLFVNGLYAGQLEGGHDAPECISSGLLRYEMKMAEDLHLMLYNDKGETKDIGIINLYSISTGIKIKPTKDARIFVDHALDDICTLVYLNWK